MQRHRATGVISTSTSQGDVQSSHTIPPELMQCPNCGKKTVRIVSHTSNNPDRAFIKCKSNTSAIEVSESQNKVRESPSNGEN